MKVVSIFRAEENLKELTERLNAEGYSNLHIRSLSADNPQEVLEEVFISRSEKYGLIIGLLTGATIGTIISYLSVNNILIMPLLLRLEAAGDIAVAFFWVMIGMIFGGFTGALAGLGYNTIPVGRGNKMLIIYCRSEERAGVLAIIENYKGLII